MSNSGSRHASSSTHYAFPLDDYRVYGRRQEPRARDPQLGESSRPRRVSTGTWALRASDHNRAPSWVDVQVGGIAPRRSSSSREIPAPALHNLPIGAPGIYEERDYDCGDVLNSPTPSSPSAKSLSLAPSEDHVRLARAAALARSISKQRAAGLDPSAQTDTRPLGSWWAFLPGAAADGSRVSIADGERRAESEADRRRSGADVGPSTSPQTFRPRNPVSVGQQHSAGAAAIDGLLTDGSRLHSQTGHRDVGEQLHGVGWRPPRPGLPGARAHGDSPGCAPSPGKPLVRSLWNSNLVPPPSIVIRMPSFRAGSGPGARERPRPRANEYAPYESAPSLETKWAPASPVRPRVLTAHAETKSAGSSTAAPRAPVQRSSLVAAPSDAGAGVLHSEEGLSTESERRALYQFDQLMLERGLVGVFKLSILQNVIDDERYWQFKCTLLVMEPYPSERCVYRGARVTRATRIEARAAAAQDALSALSANPTIARRASLSPLALVPETPCPPYRRDPPSPELVIPLADVAPGPSPLTRTPPSLIVTRDDEPDDPSETCSAGTHTPSHGSMSSCYELVYDDPDLLLLDQSQMPRSVSANAASRLEWPGDPPATLTPEGDARNRPVSR